MTKEEIVSQMNNVRQTLIKDQAQLVQIMDNVLGCQILIEKLMNELNSCEVTNNVDRAE